MTVDPVVSSGWLRKSWHLIGYCNCVMSLGNPFVGRSAALCCDDALSKSVCHESVLKVSLVGTLTACVDPCQMVYGCGRLAARSE